MEFSHKSIMVEEVLKSLDVNPDGIYLDCTVGGGGHALAIGKKLSAQAQLIGLDQDDDAINAATQNLSGLACKVKIVRENFSRLDEVLDDLSIEKIDGVLFDLGVSSHQIDTPERGFSYMKNSPLDMRMDRRQKLTAHDVINSFEQDRLIKIFREYGEERFSKRIAAAICNARKISPINTTGELVKIIEDAAPRTKNGGHPAKRIFQAIRIEVNRELEILSDAINKAVDRLKVGGRIAVITFHSLEDRIVKDAFKTLAQGCICPKNFPVCICNHKAQIKVLGKVIVPAPNEINLNSRAKSAKLRVAQKILDSKEVYHGNKTQSQKL